MLIDKYLSAFDFNEVHSIRVNASGTGIYNKMLHCDVNRSLLVRLLFRLRGMPRPLYTINHLKSIGFVKLAEKPGREIVYGIITDNPVFNSCHEM